MQCALRSEVHGQRRGSIECLKWMQATLGSTISRLTHNRVRGVAPMTKMSPSVKCEQDTTEGKPDNTEGAIDCDVRKTMPRECSTAIRAMRAT